MGQIQDTKKKYANLEGWVSIVSNLGLFGLKLWAGLVSGSVALVADAWHTLSDSVSSIAILVGAYIAGKEPDKKHPYGHGRFELITTLVVGMMLIGVGVGFLIESYEKFNNHESANFGVVAIVVTIVSILTKEGLAQFAFWAGRKSDSLALKADGWHHRSDAVSSIVLLIGIALQGFFWWIDVLLGVIIAGFIIYTAIKIMGSIISVILGEEATPELKDQIKKVVEDTTSDELYMHHCHFHNYVVHKEITFHICLPAEKTIKESHVLIKNIEDRLSEELNISATIRIEPLSEDSKKKYGKQTTTDIFVEDN